MNPQDMGKAGDCMTPQKRSIEEIVSRMFELAGSGYYCGQILMAVVLEERGRSNPGLVRAIGGLGNGCGFFQETCGILTGAACILSWYAGKGADGETESENLLLMLEELNDWFRSEIDGTFQGTRCKDIAGDAAGTPSAKEICGGLLFNTYMRTNEILKKYGY